MSTKASTEFRKFLISAARRDLDAARAQPVWNDPSFVAAEDPKQQALALSAAECLGRLVLFGGAPTNGDFLPAHLVPVAMAALRDRIHWASEEAGRLGERWDMQPDFERRDELCMNAIQERTEIHAAYLGLLACIERIGEEAFAEELGELEAELEQYDIQLAHHKELLATVASSNLVRNLRDALAEEYRSATPWWLSEELEQLAEEVVDETEKLLADFRRNAPVGPAPPLLAFPTQLFQPIAAAAKSQPRQLYLVWESPDRRIQAICSVPWPGGPGPTLRIVFRSDNPEALETVRGAAVWLANVEGRIGPDNTAEFQTERIWESLNRGGRATLAVGSPQAFWPVEAEALEQAKAVLDEER